MNFNKREYGILLRSLDLFIEDTQDTINCTSIYDKLEKMRIIKVSDIGLNEVGLIIKYKGKKYSGCLTEVEE